MISLFLFSMGCPVHMVKNVALAKTFFSWFHTNLEKSNLDFFLILKISNYSGEVQVWMCIFCNPGPLDIYKSPDTAFTICVVHE